MHFKRHGNQTIKEKEKKEKKEEDKNYEMIQSDKAPEPPPAAIVWHFISQNSTQSTASRVENFICALNCQSQTKVVDFIRPVCGSSIFTSQSKSIENHQIKIKPNQRVIVNIMLLLAGSPQLLIIQVRRLDLIFFLFSFLFFSRSD